MPTITMPHSLRAGLCRPLACIVLLGVFSGCGRSTQNKASESPKAVPTVHVVAVHALDCPQTIKIQGSLLSDEQAVVGVKVAGSVATVKVDVGALVKRGDPIAAIEAHDFEIRIKQARAEEASIRARLGLKTDDDIKDLNRSKVPSVEQEKALLEESRTAFARAETLERSRSISAAEMQLAQTAFKVAETRYTAALHAIDEQIALLEKHRNLRLLAEHALEDATITAPFDGIVAARHVAPGVYLQVGDPVIDLVRTNPLRFHGGVPERHALEVELGQVATITVEGWPSPLIGKVSRLSPVLALASRSLPIEVDVPNPDLRLRAGLFAEAEIVVNARAAVLVVPRSAIVEFAGVEKVCVVAEGKASLRKVVTGRILGDDVEIIEGLRNAEQVAVDAKDVAPGPVAAVATTPSVALAKIASGG